MLRGASSWCIPLWCEYNVDDNELVIDCASTCGRGQGLHIAFNNDSLRHTNNLIIYLTSCVLNDIFIIAHKVTSSSLPHIQDHLLHNLRLYNDLLETQKIKT